MGKVILGTCVQRGRFAREMNDFDATHRALVFERGSRCLINSLLLLMTRYVSPVHEQVVTQHFEKHSSRPTSKHLRFSDSLNRLNSGQFSDAFYIPA